MNGGFDKKKIIKVNRMDLKYNLLYVYLFFFKKLVVNNEVKNEIINY